MVKIVKCKAPFNALAINNSNSGMKISSCCVFPVKDNSKEFVTSDELKNSFKTKKFYKACECCTAYTSYDVLKDNNTLQDLHIRFGNNCNAACRTCRNIRYINIDEEKIWKQIELFSYVYKQNINTVKKVVLMGGETTLFAKYIEHILEKILVIDKLSTIIIFTNGNDSNYNFFKMISSYNANNNIQIHISIDGNEQTNHIIRSGCKIENIKKTVKICRELLLNTYTATTVSVLNIFHLSSVITFLKTLNVYKNKGKTKHLLNPLTSPTEYSCNILFKDDLELILKNINENFNVYNEEVTFESIKLYLNQCISSNLTIQEKLKTRMLFFKATRIFDYLHCVDSNLLDIKFQNLNIENWIKKD